MKRIITITVLAVFVMSLFAGCSCASEKKDTKSKTTASAKTEETMKVIETTADGGTVEKDSDGNTVTKDKDGNIKSVKDKNGRALNVGEYIKSHPFAQKPASSSGSKASSSKPKKSTKSSKKTSSKKSGGKSSKNSGKSSADDEVKEEKIPEVIATVPDDEAEIETIDF